MSGACCLLVALTGCATGGGLAQDPASSHAMLRLLGIEQLEPDVAKLGKAFFAFRAQRGQWPRDSTEIVEFASQGGLDFSFESIDISRMTITPLENEKLEIGFSYHWRPFSELNTSGKAVKTHGALLLTPDGGSSMRLNAEDDAESLGKAEEKRRRPEW